MLYPDFFKGYIKNYFKDSNFSGDYTHEDGTKASYINGLPCYIEYSNGIKQWFNKAGQLHREDGPAIEWENGGKEWFINGNHHRMDGPAIEYPNGHKEWWIDGRYCSPHRFKFLIQESVYLGKSKDKYNIEWLKFLVEDGIEEFPHVPGIEQNSEFKILFDLIK